MLKVLNQVDVTRILQSDGRVIAQHPQKGHRRIRQQVQLAVMQLQHTQGSAAVPDGNAGDRYQPQFRMLLGEVGPLLVRADVRNHQRNAGAGHKAGHTFA